MKLSEMIDVKRVADVSSTLLVISFMLGIVYLISEPLTAMMYH